MGMGRKNPEKPFTAGDLAASGPSRKIRKKGRVWTPFPARPRREERPGAAAPGPRLDPDQSVRRIPARPVEGVILPGRFTGIPP